PPSEPASSDAEGSPILPVSRRGPLLAHNAAITDLERDHLLLVRRAVRSHDIGDAAEGEIGLAIQRLRELVRAIKVLPEGGVRSLDALAAEGHSMAVSVFVAALESIGVRTRVVSTERLAAGYPDGHGAENSVVDESFYNFVARRLRKRLHAALHTSNVIILSGGLLSTWGSLIRYFGPFPRNSSIVGTLGSTSATVLAALACVSLRPANPVPLDALASRPPIELRLVDCHITALHSADPRLILGEAATRPIRLLHADAAMVVASGLANGRPISPTALGLLVASGAGHGADDNDRSRRRRKPWAFVRICGLADLAERGFTGVVSPIAGDASAPLGTVLVADDNVLPHPLDPLPYVNGQSAVAITGAVRPALDAVPVALLSRRRLGLLRVEQGLLDDDAVVKGPALDSTAAARPATAAAPRRFRPPAAAAAAASLAARVLHAVDATHEIRALLSTSSLRGVSVVVEEAQPDQALAENSGVGNHDDDSDSGGGGISSGDDDDDDEDEHMAAGDVATSRVTSSSSGPKSRLERGVARAAARVRAAARPRRARVEARASVALLTAVWELRATNSNTKDDDTNSAAAAAAAAAAEAAIACTRATASVLRALAEAAAPVLFSAQARRGAAFAAHVAVPASHVERCAALLHAAMFGDAPVAAAATATDAEAAVAVPCSP
ncbi:hypothetical protein HK405_010739, partial [Cladochytrium tenue]